MFHKWFMPPLVIVFATSVSANDVKNSLPVKKPYSYINKCCPEGAVALELAVGRYRCIKANHTLVFKKKIYDKHLKYVGNFSDIFYIKPHKFADTQFSRNAQRVPPLPDDKFYVTDS
ncbi:hypothetical protein HF086_015392 [Spodoptera exigua]|uniref:Uncharacterized protein n=1 Tax=Spodoptera exigua TaxID=7107 RepID=A0A922S8N8_SPOEX|nr:hypothetical protein HF086_015392 [Spodoptera exigua]